MGWKCWHNLRIIPPTEHNFEHNTLVSWVTPEGIILYFSSITPLPIPYISTVFGSFILFRNNLNIKALPDMVIFNLYV